MPFLLPAKSGPDLLCEAVEREIKRRERRQKARPLKK